MKMTEETAIAIPDDARAVLMAFDDDYLADVLRLWDCDRKDWCESFAIILRFETDDVIVWLEEGFLKCEAGAVTESDLETSIPNTIRASVGADACLCWLYDRAYNDLIGSSDVCNDLLCSLTKRASRAQDRFSVLLL